MPTSLETSGAADSSLGNFAYRPAMPRPPRPDQPAPPSRPIVFDDDAQLADLAAAQSGDRDALERLLDRHNDRLFAVCIRLSNTRDMATDLLQESLVKIIAALPNFRGESRLSTWMIRVTVTIPACHFIESDDHGGKYHLRH